MAKLNRKKFKEIHPLMIYVLLILGTIILSGFMHLIDAQGTFYRINAVNLNVAPETEVITSLFSLSGIKYIFTNTVSNFANFTVLSNLIIVLMGISIMDKSGFLQTLITMTTKKMKKTTVTFIFVFLCVISSICGNLFYLIMLPLGALLFYYGKRNPAIGIIASFAALSCGSGLSFLFTSTDSELMGYTELAARTINQSYSLSNFSSILIMFVAVLLVSYLITIVTENLIVRKLPKYEFTEKELEEDSVTKDEKKGMKFASISALIYILIIIYNIIPGLPLSGALLDNSQALYIDKLFNVNSFFSNGFVFIVTMLFVISGLFFGIGSKSIQNHKDFFDYLGNSLNGIGNTLVMIFLASAFISIFKKANIGNVIVALFGELIRNSNFTGLPLILLIFVLVAISTLFLPSTNMKWYILSGSVVPVLMNSEISPVFAQIIYRFAETSTMNITPLLAYFIVYFALLQKYNQSDKKIILREALRYQLPYTGVVIFCLLAIIIVWYIINIPLGINNFPTL